MSQKRRIEVFTAGCPVCEETVKQVQEAACSSCEVIVYDLNKGCETNECRDKAKEYGIKVYNRKSTGKFVFYHYFSGTCFVERTSR